MTVAVKQVRKCKLLETLCLLQQIKATHHGDLGKLVVLLTALEPVSLRTLQDLKHYLTRSWNPCPKKKPKTLHGNPFHAKVLPPQPEITTAMPRLPPGFGEEAI